MRIVYGILIALIGLVVLGWLGLRVRPRPFALYSAQSSELETVPLPDDLPSPVKRFYRTLYGDRIPVIESAVISGRAQLRMFGLTLPGRFRFTHDAGQDYRHYIEVTLFGRPIMKVNEHFLDGKSRLDLPFGVVEGEPKVDQAANLGLWAESIWLPTLYLTDPRVCWEAIDEYTASLTVPFGEEQETGIARFDPQTGMLRYLEFMRYKEAADQDKTLWINQVLEWGVVDGYQTASVGAVTWFDEGRPWAVFTVEELVYNVDVRDYVRAAGP